MMQEGRLRGQNKEGARGRKAKQWGKDSAEEYQRLDAQLTNGARRAHLTTSIVHGLGR